MYIYICIYIYREREREICSLGQPCESIRAFSQLNIALQVLQPPVESGLALDRQVGSWRVPNPVHRHALRRV